MDDKKNKGQFQPGNTEPVPIYETVPINDSQNTLEGNLKPEELSPEADVTNQSVSSEFNPEVTPIDDNPIIYREQSKIPLIIGLILFFIVVFGIVYFVFARGQKGKGSQSPTPIELTYWGLWEEKEVVEPLIREYKKKNPHITIQYEKKTPQEYRQKLLTRTKNGTGPDIFRFHNTWLPEIKEVVSALPEDIMTLDTFNKTFYPIHKKDLVLGKNIFGIPLMIDGLVLISNDDLLRKAGIVATPSNWDELISVSGKVLVKGKDGQIITAGLAGGLASNVEHFSDIFGIMLLLNGGDIRKLTSAESIGALEAYRRFAEAPGNVWSEEMSNSMTAFMEGRVAMIIAPSWEVLTIKSSVPNLKISVVPVPQLPGGKQVSLATYWAEGVSSFSKNQKEAWKFLVYLSSKEAQTKQFELQSSLRLFGTAYSRVDLASLLIQHQYLGPIIKQAQQDSFVSLPLSSRTFDQGLNDEIIRYIENAITASSQGVSYSEALSTAAQGVDQILQRYKIE